MPDPIKIYNSRRLDDRITTSGQPTEAQLADLQSLGIGHIINLGLHTHERALSDEAGALCALGMKYIHLPVEFDHPTEADFEQFCDVMAALADKPVHVHCIANLRVTAFLYRWQRDICGVEDAKARILLDSVWRPGGVWAAFIGDEASISFDHRPPE